MYKRQVYEYVLSFDSTQTGVDGDFKNLDAAKATIASAVLNNITKMLVSGDATFSSKPKFNNGLNVADGNVQFPGWKFNGRFLESTDGHVKIRDKDGIARLESGNFQIMYGLDLHLAGQSGSGDFGDGGSPFNIYGLGTAVGSNLVINGNSVYRSSSSKRYKTIGRNVSEEDIEKWYQIHPVWAKYKNDYVNRNSSCFNKAMPMLIAEDVETVSYTHLEQYSYKASNIPVEEATKILRIIAKGATFTLHHLSLYHGTWRDDPFYVGKSGNISIGCLSDDGMYLKELSFNMTGKSKL